MALKPLLQARLKARQEGTTFRLNYLMTNDWAAIDNDQGLEAIVARYVTRGGRFAGLVPEPGNLASNNLYRRAP
ncbi:MAG: hypothetical protein AAF899_05130 [Pseudomonadota bacterium]